MTYQEAINVCRKYVCDSASPLVREAHEMAIAALLVEESRESFYRDMMTVTEECDACKINS